MITVNQFLDLSKNAYIQWLAARNEYPSVRNTLAFVKSVTDRTSEHSGMGSVQTARRRNDGDDAFKGTLKQGYNKTFTQGEVALQVDVTKQLRKFDKYDVIMERMRGMGRAAERRIELDIASLLTYAWASSYTNLDGETVTTTAPDGNPLIYGTHSANGSTNTFSNQLATNNNPISNTVLQNLEELGNSFIDEADGRLFPITFDTIICGMHSPTIHTIKKILNSEKEAGNAQNDTNTFKGVYDLLVVPLLGVTPSSETRDSTKNKYVFLASLKNKDYNGFRIEMSQDVMFENPEQVFESSVWQYLSTALYDFGTTKANFIVGTKGDSSAV